MPKVVELHLNTEVFLYAMTIGSNVEELSCFLTDNPSQALEYELSWLTSIVEVLVMSPQYIACLHFL